MPVEIMSTLLRVASALIPLTLLYFFLKKSNRKSPHYLQGKVVVITGASSGVGEACARLFHTLGCKLVLCGRNLDTLQKVADSLTAAAKADEFSCIHHYAPEIARLDLADLPSIPAAAAAITAAFGCRIDVLVNNAGMSYRGEIDSTKLEVDQTLLAVNYLGQVALTKALLPQLLDGGDDGSQSHVVAVSSVQGRISIPSRSAYSASKHALQAFFDCLRAEMADTRLSVHVLSPSYIKTNLSLNAMTGSGANYGAVDENTHKGFAPSAVAERLLEMILQDEPEVVMAATHIRLAVLVRALAPALFFWFMRKRAEKSRKQKMA